MATKCKTTPKVAKKSPFFGNLTTFRRELRAKPDDERACWSCVDGIGPLVALNVRKDFTTLGLSTAGCEPMVTLCPECTVAYMNSFNAAGHKKDGRTGPPFRWTVTQYLATMLADDGDRATVLRLEQFFRLGDLFDPGHGKWLGDPAAFGLRTVADWDARMTAEMMWVRENRERVEAVLFVLVREWPDHCHAAKEWVNLEMVPERG